MSKIRLYEDDKYQIAKSWLETNGRFISKRFEVNGEVKFRVSFESENIEFIELEGSDIVVITINLFDEIN